MKTFLGLAAALCLSSACGGSDSPDVSMTGLAHNAGAPAPSAVSSGSTASPKLTKHTPRSVAATSIRPSGHSTSV